MTLILILVCHVSSPAELARFQAQCGAWVSSICWGVAGSASARERVLGKERTQKEMERKDMVEVTKPRS